MYGTMAPRRKGFSTPEVCRLTGATYRQVDYWCRVGLIRPGLCDARGSGTRRRFTEDDVAALKAVRVLMDRQVGHDRILAALDLLGSLQALHVRPDYLWVGETVGAGSDQDLLDALVPADGLVVVNLRDLWSLAEAA